MDGWIEIVAGLLSGTTIFGIFEAIRYRRENKKLKQNEVKVSDVDAQKQEIELVELYKDKVLELMEQVSNKQDAGSVNQQKIIDKLDTMDERIDKQEVRLSDIVTYLNGDFQDFLKRNHKEGGQNGEN